MTARAVPIDALPDVVGVELDPSRPVRIDQAAVDRFAELSLDTQWIHTDPVRAAAQGGTIVHGLFLLSLVGGLWGGLLEVTGSPKALNYGLDRVRFLSSVPVGSTGRMRGAVAEVQARPDGMRIALDLGHRRGGRAATSIVLFLR